MTPNFRSGCRVAGAALCWLTLMASTVQAQNSLARAKDFYASAAYEEALQVLEGLRGAAAPSENSEVAAYEVFCLMALGRSNEARQAIERLVHADPQYRPVDVSPRVRTFFEDVRRPMLAEIVRQSYAKAKAAFDRKELPAAAAEFDRVVALLDEMGASADQGVADLRTLASGFRDFSRIAGTEAVRAVNPTTPEAPVAVGTSDASSSAPAPPSIFDIRDADVIPPLAISQVLPPWYPADPAEARLGFSGTLELVIAENGKVTSGRLTKDVQPRYDAILLRAIPKWTYRPAMKNGTPVAYRLVLAIRLQPSAR